MDNLDNKELIERYLDGTLSEAEREALNTRLAIDDAFRAELELHQQIHAEFADPKKLQLRDMLTDILQQEPTPTEAEKPSNGWKLAGLVLIVLLGAGLIWWMAGQTKNPMPSAPEQPQQTAPIQQTGNDPDTTQSGKTPSNAIAMVDKAAFKANKVFEARLGNGGIRSSDAAESKMTQPAMGANFTAANGQVKINFSGTIPSEADAEELPLQISVYNNLSTDVPVAQFAPQMTNRNQQVEKWTFSSRQMLRLTAGLYYYTLERKSDGELMYVGKFTVDGGR